MLRTRARRLSGLRGVRGLLSCSVGTIYNTARYVPAPVDGGATLRCVRTVTVERNQIFCWNLEVSGIRIPRCRAGSHKKLRLRTYDVKCSMVSFIHPLQIDNTASSVAMWYALRSICAYIHPETMTSFRKCMKRAEHPLANDDVAWSSNHPTGAYGTSRLEEVDRVPEQLKAMSSSLN